MLIFGMIFGGVGMNAAQKVETDFEKCIRLKDAFVNNLALIKDEDRYHYLCYTNNKGYIIAYGACREYIKDMGMAGDFTELVIASARKQDLINKKDLIKKREQCEKIRKDFIASLIVVKTSEAQIAVAKAFEKSLAECN